MKKSISVIPNSDVLRIVNEKNVNPMSDLINVHVIDWSKFNKEITELIHGKYPERKGTKFETRDYNGAIIIGDVFLIVDDEACAVESKDDVIDVYIFEISNDKSVYITSPTFVFTVNIEDVKECFTGEVKKLPDFMGERYKYNPRIANNETELVRFLSNQKINK